MLDENSPASIHVLHADGQQKVYQAPEIHRMLVGNILAPGNFFWKEGMAEWRPVSELAPESVPSFVPPKRGDSNPLPQVSPAPKAARPDVGSAWSAEAVANSPPVKRRRSSQYYGFETNPVPLTLCYQIVMLLYLGATGFFIFSCLAKIEGWSSLSNDDVPYFFHYQLFLVLAHAIEEILLFVWIYHTNENCRGLARNMTFTSGWAVGWFFVPFLNLVRPYQVMQEIWKVSQNPRGWAGRRDSIFVGYWFGFRLIGFILVNGAFRTADSASDVEAVRKIGELIVQATYEGYAFLTVMNSLVLVSIVTWSQYRLVKQSEAEE